MAKFILKWNFVMSKTVSIRRNRSHDFEKKINKNNVSGFSCCLFYREYLKSYLGIVADQSIYDNESSQTHKL